MHDTYGHLGSRVSLRATPQDPEDAVYLEPSTSLRRLRLSTVYSSQNALGGREMSSPLLATLSPLVPSLVRPSSLQVCVEISVG